MRRLLDRLMTRVYRWQADRSVAAQLMTTVERMRVIYWRRLADWYKQQHGVQS